MVAYEMIYEILIDYTTGDSFNSGRIREEPLGIVNEDLHKAKENLRIIREHWEKYGGKGYNDDAHSLRMLLDDGTFRTISPFWMGYFETLHGARIHSEESNMEFEV